VGGYIQTAGAVDVELTEIAMSALLVTTLRVELVLAPASTGGKALLAEHSEEATAALAQLTPIGVMDFSMASLVTGPQPVTLLSGNVVDPGGAEVNASLDLWIRLDETFLVRMRDLLTELPTSSLGC
jgi:hypothetical protein